MVNFEHVATIHLPVGPAGGEDTVEIEVKLQCKASSGRAATRLDPEEAPTVSAKPTHFRYPALGKNAPWVKFVLGSLDGDGYIHSRAEDWIDENEEELLNAAHEWALEEGAE